VCAHNEEQVASTAPGQTALPLSKLLDLKMQQKASCWMGKIQNVQLQSPICEVEDYYSSNSSSHSPKGACMSETEVESSKSVVMPAMMTSTTTLEEEIANMKAILEKLTRDNKEKEAHIKLQEEKIAKLTRKLEKRPAQKARTQKKCPSTLKPLTARSSQRKALPLNMTSPLDQ